MGRCVWSADCTGDTTFPTTQTPAAYYVTFWLYRNHLCRMLCRLFRNLFLWWVRIAGKNDASSYCYRPHPCSIELWPRWVAHHHTDVLDRNSIFRIAKYGTGATHTAQRGHCCGPSFEEEQLEDVQELKRLQKESKELREAAAVKSTQPKASVEMSTTWNSAIHETKVDVFWCAWNN